MVALVKKFKDISMRYLHETGSDQQVLFYIETHSTEFQSVTERSSISET